MKKKYTISNKDKNDWIAFTKKMGTINPKQVDLIREVLKINKVPTLDLHGFSLDEANTKVEEIITYCSSKNYNEIIFNSKCIILQKYL